jgi:hypothetical protein
MACHMTTEDMFDLEEVELAKSDSMLAEPGSPARSDSAVAVEESKTEIYDLVRGGCVVMTSAGPIQFGIPPETVKDSLIAGKEVPTYFVVPTERFDRKVGISVAEFEFPAYFNFFVKKRQVSIICTEEARDAIRIIFQETLLGPENMDDLEKEFHHEVPKD